MTITVTCFGGLLLRDAERRVLPLSGRRADALLARLLWDQGAPVPKSILVDLLWPERDGTGGSALRQAVHVLRNTLGTDAVATAHGHVTLMSDAVQSDLRQLKDPATAPAAAAVMRDTVGAGGFLAGLRPASPAFAAWLDTARAHADGIAAEALIALAQEQIGAGETRRAIQAAQAALGLMPASETALALIVDGCIMLGEGQEARQTVETFTRQIGTPSHAIVARLRVVTSGEATSSSRKDSAQNRMFMVLGLVLPNQTADATDPLALELERAGAHGILKRQGTITAIIGSPGPRQTIVSDAIRTAYTLAAHPLAPAVGLCLARAREDETGRFHLREVDRARALALADEAGPAKVGWDRTIEGLSGAEMLCRDIPPRPQPFVGRQLELDQIDILWGTMTSSSEARVLVVSGPPGIGKSRLIREQSARMAADKAPFAILPGGLAHQADIITRLLPAVSVPNREAAQVSPNEAPIERLHVLLSTRNAPLMIVIEDAEELTGSDNERLAQVIDGSKQSSLLWVLCARCETPGSLPVLDRIAGRLPLTELFLSELPAHDAHAIAARYPISDKDRETCLARAGGHPLFLSQVLQHAAEGSDTCCPVSIEEAISARLSTLDTQTFASLRILAILGADLPAQSLFELAAVGDEVVETLLRRRLIRREAGHLRIEHGLIVSAILAMTSEQEQRKIHARAARWFADKDLERHAWHSREAGDPGAAKALLRAATHARKVGRPSTAARLAVAGVGVAKGKALQAQLRIEEGFARAAEGDLAAAERAFDLAMHLTLDRSIRAEALIGLAHLERLQDRPAAGFDVLDQAEPLVETDEQRARLQITRGRLLYVAGKWKDSIAPNKAAVDFARMARNATLEAEALGGLADAAYAIGDMPAAEAYATKAINTGDAKAQDTAQNALLAHVLIYDGRLDDGERLAIQTAQEAERMSDWRAEINAQLGIASAAFCRDDLDACQTAAERAAELAARAGTERFTLVSGLYQARISIARGDFSAARKTLARLGSALNATHQNIHAPQFALLSAYVAEDADATAEWLVQAQSQLGAGAAAHNALRVLPAAALLWRQLGAEERSRRALDALADPAIAGCSEWRRIMHDAIAQSEHKNDMRAVLTTVRAAKLHRLAHALENTSDAREPLLVC